MNNRLEEILYNLTKEEPLLGWILPILIFAPNTIKEFKNISEKENKNEDK